MSAGVSTYGGCPECGETQRHKPLCSVNIDVTHELAAQVSRDIEKVAVSQKRLRDLIDEIRRAREAENRQAAGLAVPRWPPELAGMDHQQAMEAAARYARRAAASSAGLAEVARFGGIPVIADPAMPEGQFRIEQTPAAGDVLGGPDATGNVRKAEPPHPLGGGEA